MFDKSFDFDKIIHFNLFQGRNQELQGLKIFACFLIYPSLLKTHFLHLKFDRIEKLKINFLSVNVEE
jgi:hypothetical protein